MPPFIENPDLQQKEAEIAQRIEILTQSARQINTDLSHALRLYEAAPTHPVFKSRTLEELEKLIRNYEEQKLAFQDKASLIEAYAPRDISLFCYMTVVHILEAEKQLEAAMAETYERDDAFGVEAFNQREIIIDVRRLTGTVLSYVNYALQVAGNTPLPLTATAEMQYQTTKSAYDQTLGELATMLLPPNGADTIKETLEKLDAQGRLEELKTLLVRKKHLSDQCENILRLYAPTDQRLILFQVAGSIDKSMELMIEHKIWTQGMAHQPEDISIPDIIKEDGTSLDARSIFIKFVIVSDLRKMLHAKYTEVRPETEN